MGFADYDRRRLLDTNTVPDGVSNSYGHSDTDSDAHTNSHSCAHCDTDCFNNSNRNTHSRT